MRTEGEGSVDRGTAKDRSTRGRGARRSRRRRALVACALTLLALPGAAGCGESGEEKAAARARAVAAAQHARELAAGRRVFAEHCDSCHTLAGKRYTKPVIEWEAPNLDEVRLKRKYVEYRLEYGGPAMASFIRSLPEPDVRAVITYVTETAGRDVVDDGDQPPQEIAAGREVFAANCARCHGIEGRAMTGDPVYPGIDFNLVKPSVRMVREKARRGIALHVGIMPAFGRRLSGAELDAVATYVNAVAAEGPEAPRTPFETLLGNG